ncbi:ribosome small subunit-dependent GTPase A [Saprospira grandis DSM 2844]|uniref:Small ribosomal subunit biogenesis GTPase RsgA n=1 Tax=Saprospira grandis DSM 2844 TaxID=694433 RepID=J1I604_9BACT|nr:ribosome small subunit-dependent GTPase A [Saprospira grandis]EJF53818.1 ribosome small subunit-dependent GTPase A [Saprospira grandis DSM 2844]
MQGTVIKSTGSWYRVQTPDHKVYDCRIKGKFRLKGYKLTNPVAVGDEVLFEQEKGLETGMIHKILPRQNYVLRRSTRQKHHQHLIACNLDQALLVVTLREPNVKLGFIDRFLLTTEAYSIPTYIILNKADLYDEDDLEMYEGLKILYGRASYQTRLVSAQTGEGLEELKLLLKDKRSLFSGHSGVGKSSLINALVPGFGLRTNEVSDYSQKGMHTTTFAELFTLPQGGEIIDTPGIKELGFLNLEPQDVAHNFPEIFEASKNCKYNNCLHINEPHCAVKAGLETGEIHELRYQSYLSIMEEIQEQNHWERHL